MDWFYSVVTHLQYKQKYETYIYTCVHIGVDTTCVYLIERRLFQTLMPIYGYNGGEVHTAGLYMYMYVLICSSQFTEKCKEFSQRNVYTYNSSLADQWLNRIKPLGPGKLTANNATAAMCVVFTLCLCMRTYVCMYARMFQYVNCCCEIILSGLRARKSKHWIIRNTVIHVHVRIHSVVVSDQIVMKILLYTCIYMYTHTIRSFDQSVGKERSIRDVQIT